MYVYVYPIFFGKTALDHFIDFANADVCLFFFLLEGFAAKTPEATRQFEYFFLL